MSRETVSVKSIENLIDEIGGLLAGQKSNVQDQQLDQTINLLQQPNQQALVNTGQGQEQLSVLTTSLQQRLNQRQGMCRHTGKILKGIDHLKQSITDIITTRIGSRVMRRSYGSNAPDYVDGTGNPKTLIKLYAEVATALKKFEPRLALHRIQLSTPTPTITGKLELLLEADYLGDKIFIEGVSL